MGATNSSIPVSISALAFNGATLYVGVSNGYEGGIVTTTNLGTAWTEFDKGLSDFSVNAIAVIGTSVYIGTSYFGMVYQANDTGWTPLAQLFYPIRSIVGVQENLYAGTIGGGVLRSTNFGSSWASMNNGLMDTTVQSLVSYGGNIFAGTDNGMFLVGNGNTNWSPITTGLSNSNIRSLGATSTGVVAGTGGGVFQSTNNGGLWALIGLPQSNIAALSASARSGFIYAGATGGGVFRSSDNGTTWTPIDNGLGDENVLSLSTLGSYLYAGTASDIYLSMDNGNTWTNTNNAELAGQSVNALFVPPTGTRIYAAANSPSFGGAVFSSTDNGALWRLQIPISRKNISRRYWTAAQRLLRARITAACTSQSIPEWISVPRTPACRTLTSMHWRQTVRTCLRARSRAFSFQRTMAWNGQPPGSRELMVPHCTLMRLSLLPVRMPACISPPITARFGRR